MQTAHSALSDNFSALHIPRRRRMPKLNHWQAPTPHFDRWQFERRYKPFQAQRKISHDDYARMGPDNHALMQVRPGGYPGWLANDAKIRAVLSHALIGGPAGSLEDLKTRAHAKFLHYFQHYCWTNEGAARYRAVAHCQNIVRLYARLVFFYRLGYDSRQIGRECGMSPARL